MQTPPHNEDSQSNVTFEPGFSLALSHNLKTAIAAITQRSEVQRFHATLAQLAAICLILWVISALDDFIDNDFGGQLALWGVIGDAALNYFWLLAIAVVCLMLQRGEYFLPFALGSGAVSAMVSLIWVPATYFWETLAPMNYARFLTNAWWGVFVIECAAFFRIVSWYCAFRIDRRIALTLVYGGIILLSIWYMPPQSLFYQPWEEDSDTRLNVEDTYYSQTNLMTQAIYDIASERPGEVDVYSIAFGAYGDQDVFKRETDGALEAISKRFGSHNKSLALINNPATVLNTPLASGHNLARGIREIAAKMNLDEDIMLLFLTSHGDEDATLAVQLGQLDLTDLDAVSLRAMLDDTYTYWRVIIISACYSGSFIEHLKSPTTLIMTAAAADKASFGCEHSRDWTYFGEALFAGAFPQNLTLVESFQAAKQQIAERESSEGKEPSDPQIWIGEAIKAYLTLHAL